MKNLNIKRNIRFFFQRLFRGFDDSETWSLDCILAKHILPRLKRFKQVNIAYPTDLSFVQWNEYLDEMIYAFEYYASEKIYQFDFKPEEYQRVQQGLKLFSQYYGGLWW